MSYTLDRPRHAGGCKFAVLSRIDTRVTDMCRGTAIACAKTPCVILIERGADQIAVDMTGKTIPHHQVSAAWPFAWDEFNAS